MFSLRMRALAIANSSAGALYVLNEPSAFDIVSFEGRFDSVFIGVPFV